MKRNAQMRRIRIAAKRADFSRKTEMFRFLIQLQWKHKTNVEKNIEGRYSKYSNPFPFIS